MGKLKRLDKIQTNILTPRFGSIIQLSYMGNLCKGCFVKDKHKFSLPFINNSTS